MAYRISHTKLRNLVSKYFLHNHQIKFTLWAGNFYYPRMIYISILFTISVQFSSVTQSCLTLCDPMNCSTPGLPIRHQLQEFTQTQIHWISDAIQHLILCCPLLLLPSIFPSIRVFSNESALCIRWLKYWSFSLNISPSGEHPELISFRMDWLISLQSKGLSRVFSNTTVQKHQFFSTQLSSQSNFHILTWKTIALTRRTFVGEVMSLLFSMLSRLVITFLPRSKRLLISWLQSPSAVIPLQPLFPLFPHHFPWSEGTGCHDLSFLNVEL